MRRTLIALVFLLLSQWASTPVAAQETRIVPLRVSNWLGKETGELQANQISIKGVKAEWSLAYDTGPRRIVILVDTSSMKDAVRWRRATNFIQGLINVAKQDDQLALYELTEQHGFLVPLTRDRQAILAALEALSQTNPPEKRGRSKRDTQLMDSLEAVCKEPLIWGDAILVLSDWWENKTGRVRRRTLPALLVNRGLRLFHVSLADPLRYDSDPAHPGTEWAVIGYSPVAMLPNPVLYELVNATGGSSFALTSPARDAPDVTGEIRLPRVARRAYLAMKEVYRVELKLKEQLTKPKRLEVRVTDKKVRKDSKPYFAYPPVLYPGSSLQPVPPSN